jgi:hypothetical protein
MLTQRPTDRDARIHRLRAALWNSSTTLSTISKATEEWSLNVHAPARTGAGGSAGSAGRHGELPGVTVPMLLDALCVPTLDFLKMCAPAARRAPRRHARRQHTDEVTSRTSRPICPLLSSTLHHGSTTGCETGVS